MHSCICTRTLVLNGVQKRGFTGQSTNPNRTDDSVIQGKRSWPEPRECKRCVVTDRRVLWMDTQDTAGKKMAHYLTDADTSDEDSLTSAGQKRFYLAGLYDCANIHIHHHHNKQPTPSAFKNTTPFLIQNRYRNGSIPDLPFSKVRYLIQSNEKHVKWYQVSSFINKVGNDSMKCVEPLVVDSTGIHKYFNGWGA